MTRNIDPIPIIKFDPLNAASSKALLKDYVLLNLNIFIYMASV